MTYSYTTTAADTGFWAAFAGIMIFIILIALAVAVVSIIGMWKMFTKAGEEGWKSIIPIYNMITLCKIVGVNPWWILIVYGASLLSGIPILGLLISLVSFAASIYFSILLCVSTANSFGKDTGFAVGLFFLSPIFYCILGFGSAKYEGAKPMNDIIFKNNK